MNSTNFVYSLSSQAYQPYLTVPSPVSEESADLTTSSFKPIEQTAESDSPLQTAQYEKYENKSFEEKRKQQVRQEQVDQQTINKLSKLDRDVRNHELAHASVGGRYTGSPSYQYERGPDGINYAIAGEVSISTSPIKGNPELTLEKAQIVQRAALAPADPSPQDYKIAMEALQLEIKARMELTLERQQEQHTEATSMKEDGSITKSDVKTSLVDDKTDPLDRVDDVAESLNQVQEEAFTLLNRELTEQLVALSDAQSISHTLGERINQHI